MYISNKIKDMASTSYPAFIRYSNRIFTEGMGKHVNRFIVRPRPAENKQTIHKLFFVRCVFAGTF